VSTQQQYRDRNLNEMRNILREQWSRRPQQRLCDIEDQLSWFVDTQGIGAMKVTNMRFSAAQLAAIALKWREFPDYWPSMRERLEAWRRDDKYWLEIQANQRDRLRGRRLEAYRLLAREVVSKYGMIKLGAIDLAGISRLEHSDGQENELHQRSRRQRQRAALSILRRELCHQADKAGVHVLSVSGPFSQICHICTQRCEVTEALIHTCEYCASVWDQDINAARNLLAAQPEEH
jgi:hypothetical protein